MASNPATGTFFPLFILRGLWLYYNKKQFDYIVTEILDFLKIANAIKMLKCRKTLLSDLRSYILVLKRCDLCELHCHIIALILRNSYYYEVSLYILEKQWFLCAYQES